MTEARTPVFERLFELAVVVGDAMEHGLSVRGLTPSRAEVLWRLHHQGAMTQRELSDALRCSPRNVTGLVDGLQTDGFVARGPHPTDRRATLVTLTDKGNTTVRELHDRHEQSAREFVEDIPPADVDVALGVIDRLITRLRADTIEP